MPLNGCLSLKEPGEGNADLKTQGFAICSRVQGTAEGAPRLGPCLTGSEPGGGGRAGVLHSPLMSAGRGGVQRRGAGP